MARANSFDLRERVVAAVTAGELSRREAAARFGEAVSTEIKWVDRYQATGSAAPGKMGGHKPKKIAGRHADWLRRHCRERAFVLHGLASGLASERSLKVDCHSVWAFVHAEKPSYKKGRWSPVTAITATSTGGGYSGSNIKAGSTRAVWYSSTAHQDRRAGGAA